MSGLRDADLGATPAVPPGWAPPPPLPIIRRESCPWCRAPERTTLCDLSYDDEPLRSGVQQDPGPQPGRRYTVHECRRCRTLYQETVFEEDASARYYEWWPFVETPLEYRLFYVQELLMVLGHLGRPAGDIRVFDYGMGWGRFCQAATALGINASGYEINRNMREYCRARSLRSVDRMDEVEPGSLDFINLEQVLEHVVAPRDLIESLMPYLRKGGIMKVSVPARPPRIASTLRSIPSTAPHRLVSRLVDIWPFIHINCFNPRTLKSVLADTLSYGRIHVNSLFLVFRRDLLPRVLGRPIYKNYFPRVNYLFFEKR